MGVLAGLVALVAAGGVIAFQLVHAGMAYPGVRVGDVPVGETTKNGALAALEPILTEKASRLVRLHLDGAEREATLADLGATFDAAAAVESAYSVGREGGWGDRIAAQLVALTRGYAVEAPGLRIDRSKLEGYLEDRAREIDRRVRDAELVIGDDLGVWVIPSAVGRKLDMSAAVEAVEQAVRSEALAVELPVLETWPRRTETELEEARGTVTGILSGPVALEFEGRRWTLGAREIAELLSVEQEAGPRAPVVSLREEPLMQMIDRIAAEIDRPAISARLEANGGNLRLVRPGQDGRKVDVIAALAALKEAIPSDRRTVPLPVEVDRAVGGSLVPDELGIKELIESGRTPLVGVPEKIHNIVLAASRLDGVVVPPGEVFSFNKELGPTTLAAGYQVGFGIVAGENGEAQTVPSVAGGICQVSTTLLQAVFWAGYQIDELYPHLYWIPTYGSPPRGMVGLDAAVDDPNLDFRFRNNTDSYLLIRSRIDGGYLEFDLHGTRPNWKVEVEGPVITNVVRADPTVVRQEEPALAEGKEVWAEQATDGMDVTILRRVTQGNEVRTVWVRSSYQPSRNVLMVGSGGPATSPIAQAPPAGSR